MGHSAFRNCTLKSKQPDKGLKGLRTGARQCAAEPLAPNGEILKSSLFGDRTAIEPPAVE